MLDRSLLLAVQTAKSKFYGHQTSDSELRNSEKMAGLREDRRELVVLDDLATTITATSTITTTKAAIKLAEEKSRVIKMLETNVNKERKPVKISGLQRLRRF
jgi:hypothetical protein